MNGILFSVIDLLKWWLSVAMLKYNKIGMFSKQTWSNKKGQFYLDLSRRTYLECRPGYLEYDVNPKSIDLGCDDQQHWWFIQLSNKSRR